MTSQKWLPPAIAAGLFLAAAASLKYLEHAGRIGPNTAERCLQIATGLMLAWYGNAIPKSLRHHLDPIRARRMQTALRISGWAFVLAGLSTALLWSAAPLAWADALSMPLIAAAVLITGAYALWACPSGRWFHAANRS